MGRTDHRAPRLTGQLRTGRLHAQHFSVWAAGEITSATRSDRGAQGRLAFKHTMTIRAGFRQPIRRRQHVGNESGSGTCVILDGVTVGKGVIAHGAYEQEYRLGDSGGNPVVLGGAFLRGTSHARTAATGRPPTLLSGPRLEQADRSGAVWNATPRWLFVEDQAGVTVRASATPSRARTCARTDTSQLPRRSKAKVRGCRTKTGLVPSSSRGRPAAAPRPRRRAL